MLRSQNTSTQVGTGAVNFTVCKRTHTHICYTVHLFLISVLVTSHKHATRATQIRHFFFPGGRNGALWSIDVTVQCWHVGSWQKKRTQKFPTVSNAAGVHGSPQRTSIVSLCVSANLYVTQVPTGVTWSSRSLHCSATCR